VTKLTHRQQWSPRAEGTSSREKADGGRIWARKRRLDAAAFRRKKEPNGGSVSASDRLEIENVLGCRRENDPVAPVRPNNRSDLKQIPSPNSVRCLAAKPPTVGVPAKLQIIQCLQFVDQLDDVFHLRLALAGHQLRQHALEPVWQSKTGCPFGWPPFLEESEPLNRC
jgi:hypothetical protein